MNYWLKVLYTMRLKHKSNLRAFRGHGNGYYYCVDFYINERYISQAYIGFVGCYGKTIKID